LASILANQLVVQVYVFGSVSSWSREQGLFVETVAWSL